MKLEINEILTNIEVKYKNKQFLLVLCGNIGTGKTTFREKLTRLRFNPRLFSVDVDSIAQMIEGGDYTRFDEQNHKVYGTLKRETTESLIEKGFSVVVDGLHYLRGMRVFYTSLGRYNNIPVICVNLGRGNRMSLKKRIQDGRGFKKELWNRVHTRTYKSFERPKILEGFKNIYEFESNCK